MSLRNPSRNEFPAFRLLGLPELLSEGGTSNALHSLPFRRNPFHLKGKLGPVSSDQHPVGPGTVPAVQSRRRIFLARIPQISLSILGKTQSPYSRHLEMIRRGDSDLSRRSRRRRRKPESPLHIDHPCNPCHPCQKKLMRLRRPPNRPLPLTYFPSLPMTNDKRPMIIPHMTIK